MTTDLEDRLHTDMVRLTRDIHVPPGMALRAYRHNHKRRRTLRLTVASGAATAVAASAMAIAGVSGVFDSAAPAPQTTQTTAYVVKHVENALAPASVDDLVNFSRQTFLAGATWQPVPGGLKGGITADGTSSPWLTAYMLRWAYQGNQKTSAYSPSGQHVFDVGISAQNGSATQTAVIYGNRTWWTTSVSPSGSGSGSPGCTTGSIALNSGPGSGWPAFIRSQLSCGAYQVVGHQVVDGIDAVKITGHGRPLTLFVDPATYLPVQLDIGPGRIDFTWLSPTAANLAQLKLSVPAGFQQVPPPQPGVRHLCRA